MYSIASRSLWETNGDVKKRERSNSFEKVNKFVPEQKKPTECVTDLD